MYTIEQCKTEADKRSPCVHQVNGRRANAVTFLKFQLLNVQPALITQAVGYDFETVLDATAAKMGLEHLAPETMLAVCAALGELVRLSHASIAGECPVCHRGRIVKGVCGNCAEGATTTPKGRKRFVVSFTPPDDDNGELREVFALNHTQALQRAVADAAAFGETDFATHPVAWVSEMTHTGGTTWALEVTQAYGRCGDLWYPAHVAAKADESTSNRQFSVVNHKTNTQATRLAPSPRAALLAVVSCRRQGRVNPLVKTVEVTDTEAREVSVFELITTTSGNEVWHDLETLVRVVHPVVLTCTVCATRYTRGVEPDDKCPTCTPGPRNMRPLLPPDDQNVECVHCGASFPLMPAALDDACPKCGRCPFHPEQLENAPGANDHTGDLTAEG